MKTRPEKIVDIGTRRQLTIAIFHAMEFFSDERYALFLQKSKPSPLNRKWFEWFIGAWSVARTISKKSREQVRGYLNNEFRVIVASTRDEGAVDNGVAYMRSKKWGSRLRKDGKSSTTLSLVSKTAFFLRPDMFIPFDSTALRGLNKLRGIKKDGGIGKLSNPSYSEYFHEFERVERASRRQVLATLRTSWVTSVAAQFGLSQKVIARPAFRRKVVDNLLMQMGGRRQ